MAIQMISCPGAIDYVSNGGVIARCSVDWLVVTSADIITDGLSSSLPNPDSMLLAFGAGLVTMLPLYAALWGIRAARAAIKKS